jgi:hypothetical protein
MRAYRQIPRNRGNGDVGDGGIKDVHEGGKGKRYGGGNQ